MRKRGGSGGWWAAAVVLALAAGGCDQIETQTPYSSPGGSPAGAVAGAGAAGGPVGGAMAPAGLAAPVEMDLTGVSQGLQAIARPTLEQSFGARSVHPTASPTAVRATELGWEVRMPSGSPVSTPAVVDGKVYVTGGFNSMEFHALDAATGRPAWSVGLEDNGPSMPVVSDGVVVVNTESCTTFAMDAATGRSRWGWYLGDPQVSAPAAGQGRVVTSYPTYKGGSSSHAIVCFSLQEGKLLWQTVVDGDAISSPVIAGDEVLLSTFSGTLYRLDLNTGTVLKAARNRVASAPTAVGDDVHFTRRSDAGDGDAVREAIGSWRGGASAMASAPEGRPAPYLDHRVQERSNLADDSRSLDAAVGFGGDGAPGYGAASPAAAHIGHATVAALQAFQSSRVTHRDGKLYATMGDTLYCVDAASGDVVWEHAFEGDLVEEGGSLATAPAWAGGEVVVGTLSGEVLRLDAASGEVKARYAIGSPIRQQPAVDAGRIYVGTADGRVVCVETGEPSLTGWPMWGKDATRNADADAPPAR